ncbi:MULTISPECIES: homocysteine S-methyltransferase [Pantoea]|uniref:Homocysteine S-methyltransferase n=1 Tax=Pantoea dispersa TaxID=59814 RepID=A0ABY2ZW82_9GAMM|nr:MULTISPECIES: homocysteine S-methyltransferase [Pantoea]KTS14735.1 homocysteine methyltransferase [Pantoea dispersa]KTS87314.1 homocysteine methyltransferase [Pantoea dispersa]MBU6518412.1 homocysteine S-methyltransferase [Pantoea sp. B270]MBZ6391595.1 homocysteine S-methyltransferase [Pantoea dispersa]MDI6955626.1 homocysteine S-methyltransferase [Pantoea sp. Pa-EAmG]
MSRNPIAAALTHTDTLILDGALATELEARGCNLADTLWSAKVLMENPELIYQVHYDYFAAGANVAITASYQATPLGFAARGLDSGQASALIRQSVALAQRARDDYRAASGSEAPLLVAGSVGPYGAYLANGAEYRGDYALPAAEMKDFHRPRVAALLEAGVDLLACETLPSFGEIQALISLLAEFPHSSAWFSFTLRDAQHLSDGTPLSKVAEVINAAPQVVAVGLNCVALESVTPALQTLQALTDKPLLVYPNSGEQYDAVSKSWHSAPSGCTLHDKFPEWQQAGARLIGGCCRTTPQDIAAIAACCQP